ncbi:Apyrase [Ancylostoma caninum]|uniref:Apyrase n=1 Tax=Ancylostoma caninum TaxID=29170 RepID=A0A368FC96_ANCCA|nr:Apyrase [Ancylostoma caninum]
MRWHYEKYNSIYLGVPIMEHISNGVRIFIKNRIAPRNITMKRHANGSITYELLAITDMDREAKVGSKNWTWRAVTRRGQLTLSADKKTVSVEWMKDTDRNITSFVFCFTALFMNSNLSEFNGHLLAPDDKTGILYEIKGNKAIPWVFLNSGPGNTTDGMKVEWLTIKDDKLYAGGHGCEYRNKTGHIVSEDPMWIKVITKSGQVRSKNWKSVYRQMLRAAGYREPGYLTHEAVQWSSIQRMWYFLPRKASYTAYNETEDERKGANLLILADNSLREFFVVHVGELDHPERGFSAFDFIPNTDDKLMVALKTEEMHDNPTKSYFTVFTLNGTILLPDQKLDDGYKFEGIYFV